MNSGSIAEHKSILPIVFLLCASAGIASALLGSQLYFLAAIFYFTLIVFLSLKPDWAMYTLLVASFCTAVSLEVGPMTVRPDQVIAIAIAPSAFLFLIAGIRPAVTTRLDWLIAAYLFCNVLSSVLHSPDLKMSLQKCLLLAVTFLAYFVTTQLIQTRRILTRVLLLMIVVGILQAIYGISSVLLFTQGIDIGGAHAPYGDLYARGTFLEGNIFGSFQMMIALVLISLLFRPQFADNRGIILISLGIVLTALVMSFTRAAWIAFLIGFVAYVLFFQRMLLRRYVRHLPLILLACLLLFLFAYAFSISRKMSAGSLLDVYGARLAKIVEYKSGTASKRVQVWIYSVRSWSQNPVFGNGTDSIKVLAAGTTLPKFGDDYWIPNSMLLALHDTGLIGFALFSAIQIAFLRILLSAIRKTTSLFYGSVMEGFFVAFIGVQFTYLITNAFWLIFIWVFMGIGVSCARLAMSTPTPKKDAPANADRD